METEKGPTSDTTFLIAPPAEDAEPETEEAAADQDPMYEEALRVVLEMGKASTSTLQRRLQVGLWPRGADSGHDASGRYHRSARRKQAEGSAEEVGVAARSGRHGEVGAGHARRSVSLAGYQERQPLPI